MMIMYFVIQYRHLIKRIPGLRQLLRLPIISLLLVALFSGCSHTSSFKASTISKDDWKYKFVHYQESLSLDQIAEIRAPLQISAEMREEVQQRFSGLSKHDAAKGLADWIIDPEGLNLEFVFDANFTPTEVYQKRQANCLTYSLLLSQMAKALDIKIHVNSVDSPDTWSMESDTMFFFRHVNGLFKTATQEQAFDFTPASYDPRYPQRTISEDEALALFYNNLALDHYREGDNQQALHLIKLATSLNADNPDIWTNVGTILKQGEDREKAKQAMRFALALDKTHLVAVSQLERIYREDGDSENAQRYAALAKKTRSNNPYYLFRQSKQKFLQQEYDLAKEMVSGAIIRHRYDPRFFALLGLIETKTENFKSAQRNFKKASKLSKNEDEKDSYANKARLLGLAYKATRQNNKDRPWVNEAPVGNSILR